MGKKLILLLILLSAGSLVFTLPQPFRFISGFLQAFVLPGLLFSSFVLGARVSRSDQIFLSVLISPLLLSILVAACSFVTRDIYLSATIVLVAGYALCIVALIMRENANVQRESHVVPKQIHILSFIYGGLILLSFLANGWLFIRSDAWYHAAVVQEIANRGIPPKEPLLANVPIKYMWFYHLFQAVWIKLSGMPLFWALGFFNIMSALMFPYVIARFVSRLTGNGHLIVFATLLTVIGLDAASWILWPVSLVSALAGEVSGMDEIRRILSSISINGPDVINFLAPRGTWTINFTDKFLTITVFSYSMILFLVAVIITLERRLLEEFPFRSSILLFVLLLGVLLFHIVTGITLIGAVAGSGILMYIMSRFVHRNGVRLKILTPFLVAPMIVSVIAAVYFRTLTETGNNAPDDDWMSHVFHFGYTNVLTILMPLIVLFIPARNALRDLASSRDYESRTLTCWIACLLLPIVCVNIGSNGEARFIYFLFLLIGPLIYLQIGRQIETSTRGLRIALIAGMAVLFLVPPTLTFRGFIVSRPPNEIGDRRYTINDEDKRFFHWVETNTPDDAVIVENNIYHLTPVYAGRRNFYSWYYVTEVLYGGDIMKYYKSIQTSLYGKEEIPADVLESVRTFEKKLYIAVWWEDLKSSPWLADRFNATSGPFEEVYRSEHVALFSLK